MREIKLEAEGAIERERMEKKRDKEGGEEERCRKFTISFES